MALLIQTNRWYPDDGRKIYFTFICISILIKKYNYIHYILTILLFQIFLDLDVCSQEGREEVGEEDAEEDQHSVPPQEEETEVNDSNFEDEVCSE